MLGSARRAQSRRRGSLAAGLLALAILTLAASASVAQAEPPVLWQNCETGSAAGQCLVPRGVVADPLNGHLYVSDSSNFRIDELDAWGQLVKAWGWGVRDGSPELQTCTTATGCRKGLEGEGAGEFGYVPQGIALDSHGDVYVVDKGNSRVQKFDPEGHFLLTFGGDVNKTKVEEAGSTQAQRNLCTAASSDICQAGSEGSGQGQFGPWPFSNFIAVGPDDTVYVGDVNQIQKFDTAGAYLGQIALPEAGTVGALAADPQSGDLYFAYASDTLFVAKQPNVHRLDPASGAEIGEPVEVPIPTALAVDPRGSLYVFEANYDDPPKFKRESEILKFDSSGALIEGFQGEGFDSTDSVEAGGLEFFPTTGLATSSACGIAGVDVYGTNFKETNSFVRALGPAPDPLICPPPKVAPQVASQYALSVVSTAATLGATINPHFWPDATYYLEYGTGKCSEGGCGSKALFPGVALGGGVADAPLPTQGVFVSGLAPATTYHYRFVAQSSGGGPAQGQEASFNTLPPAPRQREPDPCPSAGFRSGPSVHLPDCRAYEMVSPVNKANGDVAVLHSLILARPARLDQAAGDGERFTYSSYRAFADPQAAPYTSQYLAIRHAGEGWSNAAISPRSEGVSFYKDPKFPGNDSAGFDTHYKAFSEDLCSGWLLQDTDPPLSAGALAGFPNLYRHEGCGAEAYEALTTVKPGVRPPEFVPAIQGFSADGLRVFFTAKGKLTADASAKRQVYESHAGSLSLVCVLPSGAAYTGICTVGSVRDLESGNRANSVDRAVSSDGSRVFWSDSENRLYVRKNPAEPQSKVSAGKCTEAAKACTVAVSPGPAFFRGAAQDGSKALFTSQGLDHSLVESLSEFDVETKATALIAGKVDGVMGASQDAGRVYFASREVLSAKANSEGAVAQAGQANLYLYDSAGSGSYAFIGILTSQDTKSQGTGSAPSPIAESPANRTSRVSPDGGYAAFTSTARLTGYDNTDQVTGVADAEVFLYDVGQAKLVCISCNPSGARPRGFEVRENGEGDSLFAAALIPGWEDQLHPSQALASDGGRLFFESLEPLVLRDTNGARDVYEWEPGSSQEDCEQSKGAELFVPSSGGCVSLISTGESPSDSSFVDASSNGRDVFFTTASSLVVQDPGLVDVYDAREGGGFAPASSPAACEGEACQGPYVAPNDPTPTSAAFNGAGNVKVAPSSCRKGKVHRKGRCLARKKHKHGKRADRNRRAAR
jgi:DNA-binding beta-propeller fold protein YncE